MAWSGGKGGRGGAEGPARNAENSELEEVLRRKGADAAWDRFEAMQRDHVFVDRFAVSRMLMKTAVSGPSRRNSTKVYRAVNLVEWFIQQSPDETDEVLFNALLDTCCRLHDLNRLESTRKRMSELRIYPSHVTLGILVKAYGQGGDISRVLQVWDEMAEQRQDANAVTYGCMIDACVRCGHMAKAVEIFQDMKRRRRHRNTVLYTMLIKGYGLEKNVRAALELFREMEHEGVPYNTITYNSMIDACIKCSDTETAEELVAEMTEPGSSVQPDLITFSTLLKGYCQLGNLDKALLVCETIKKCRLKCDERVYNTLLDGCVKANDFTVGLGLFHEMAYMGVSPSSITHSILVRLYQRNGFKGNALEAVAQLYQYHGLQRPASSENGRERTKGSGRQRQRGGQQAGGPQQGVEQSQGARGGCGGAVEWELQDATRSLQAGRLAAEWELRDATRSFQALQIQSR